MTYVCAFDLETCSTDELHRRPDFVRLGGYTEPSGQIRITSDMDELIGALLAADVITAHFGSNFDAVALAKWYGIRYDRITGMPLYESLMAKMWDTVIVERHLIPVAAKHGQDGTFYDLDALAVRYGVHGKSGDIRKIARKWGGYDRIPLDDPEYVDYLTADIAAQHGVYLGQVAAMSAMTEQDWRYIQDEHHNAAIMGRTQLEGVRMDTSLTMARHAAGQARLEASKLRLHQEHGMPLDGAKPHTTNLGKAAFKRAILATGISENALRANWPMTEGGMLKTGKDVLAPLIDSFTRYGREDAADLCKTIMQMNGERTVYGTALSHIVDDRVHLDFKCGQASGRWSNWVTVLGKKDGKFEERAMILADEGDVLVSIDLDQIDLRIVAAECQDPEYMKLFEPGKDVHSEVANAVFACGLDGKGKAPTAYRDRAKACSIGTVYGGGVKTLTDAGVDPGVARQFLNGMAAAYPRRAEWIEEVRRAAGMIPYGEVAPADDSFRILHTWAGRPIRVERARAYTQAVAQVGQGGTRDAIAFGLRRMPLDLQRRLKAVIHDEVIMSLREESWEADAQRVLDAMQFNLKGVRLTAGVSKPGKSLADCYRA